MTVVLVVGFLLSTTLIRLLSILLSTSSKEQGIKKASNSMVRAMVKMKIIWKGNIISCMKSFNKRTCKLCMKERMLILEGMEENPKKLINTRAEIYGGCKHKTAFHRFKNIYTPVEQSSTDDGISQKESIRVILISW